MTAYIELVEHLRRLEAEFMSRRLAGSLVHRGRRRRVQPHRRPGALEVSHGDRHEPTATAPLCPLQTCWRASGATTRPGGSPVRTEWGSRSTTRYRCRQSA